MTERGRAESLTGFEARGSNASKPAAQVRGMGGSKGSAPDARRVGGVRISRTGGSRRQADSGAAVDEARCQG
jgi:hypothetical protein